MQRRMQARDVPMRSEPLGSGTPSGVSGCITPSVEGSSQRADLACLAILSLLWVVMVVLAKPIGDFPLNDDWVYGLAVRSIVEHGEFRLPSPADTNLFAQAYWGALFCLPFGFSFTALRLSTLVLGLIGVWATFGTARELGVGRSIALLAAALVASNPIYFALANTFMTDVPFFAVAAASLYFLARWTFRLDPRDALIGLLLSMIAILIRQAGIVIPTGFAIAYVIKRGPSAKTILVAAIPVLIGVALHFGFQAWLHETGRTPGAGPTSLLETVADNLRVRLRIPVRIFALCAYAGLFSLPLLAVVTSQVWGRAESARRRILLAVCVVAAVVYAGGVFVVGRPMPFLDNVFNAFGMGPLTLTDTYFFHRNFPDVPPSLSAFWFAVTIAALLGFVALACVVADRVMENRSPERVSQSAPAMIIIGGSCLAYMLLAALALRFFLDRYALFVLLPVVLFVASFTAREASPGPSRGGSVLLAIVVALEASFTVIATRDYLEWNRTRWVATSELLAQGIPRTSIDGGYEFNGWLGYDAAYRRQPGKSPWWVVDDEYTIASGPLPGFLVFRTYPIPRLLTGGQSQVLVLRREQP